MHRGHRSRADLGLRRPRSRSLNVRPDLGGVAVHYLGPAAKIDIEIRGHARCEKVWRGVQDYHMDVKRWADLAYTAAFCQHGYTFAGRGLGVRTAANGTNDANYRYLAFVFIGGDGEEPTDDALDGLDYLIGEARAAGAGDALEPHQALRQTSCPGVYLVGYRVGLRSGRVVPPAVDLPPTVTPPGLDLSTVQTIKYGDRGEFVGRLQGLLLAWGYRTFDGHHPDKDWGPRTDRAVRTFCKERRMISADYSGPISVGPKVFTRLVTG